MLRKPGHIEVGSPSKNDGSIETPVKTVNVRSASISDAEFVARAILIATRSQLEYGFWDAVLDLNEEECLKALAILASSSFESWNHCNKFLLAEADGQPVAALCTFDPEHTGALILFQALEELFKLLNLSSEQEYRIWEKMKECASAVPEHQAGTFVIENTATLPEYRNRGYASLLVRKALESARESGYKTAALNILIGNERAKRVYERHGFVVTQENRVESFEEIFGVPGVQRMECLLSKAASHGQ